MEDVLTREEAAAFLKVPVKTLALWAHLGNGPKYARIGRHCRYRTHDLLEFLESRAVVRKTPA